MVTKQEEFALYCKLSEIMTPELFKQLTLFTNGSNEELIERLKTKYLGCFIDKGVSVQASLSEAKNTKALFAELEVFLNEQDISLYSYNNKKFYHPDSLSWFPDAKVRATTPTFQIPGLPKEGMTENEMIAEAGTLKREYKHPYDEIIRSIRPMFEAGILKKGDKNKYFIAMLKDVYGGNACKAIFGFHGGGKFCFDVFHVSGGRRWYDLFSLFLSNETK